MTDKMTVALIQTVQAWEDKATNFKHFEPLIREASSTDLIVLPEMFSTGFSMNSAQLAEPSRGNGDLAPRYVKRCRQYLNRQFYRRRARPIFQSRVLDRAWCVARVLR